MSISRPSRSRASPARRRPGDHGLGRGDAAGKRILDDCRRRLDDLVEHARAGHPSPSSSIWTAISTPPRRTCSRRSRRPRAGCRQACRRRRPCARSIRRNRRSCIMAVELGHAAADARSTSYAETLLARQLSTLDGVAQVNVFGAQKYAVRIQADPDALAARGIGIDQVAAAAKAANVQRGHRRAERPAAVRADPRRRPADRRRASSPTRSSPIATARRCASRTSPTSIDSVENNRTAQLVQRPAARSCWRSTRQPGSNTIAGRQRDQAGAAEVPGPGCRLGIASERASTTAASRSAPRSTTCS